MLDIDEDRPDIDEDRIDTLKALEIAREAFEKYLTDQGYDSGYWTIRFTAWTLTTNEFTPMVKFEIDTRSEADGKYHNGKETGGD
jgi:hypothetical protein